MDCRASKVYCSRHVINTIPYVFQVRIAGSLDFLVRVVLRGWPCPFRLRGINITASFSSRRTLTFLHGAQSPRLRTHPSSCHFRPPYIPTPAFPIGDSWKCYINFAVNNSRLHLQATHLSHLHRIGLYPGSGSLPPSWPKFHCPRSRDESPVDREAQEIPPNTVRSGCRAARY